MKTIAAVSLSVALATFATGCVLAPKAGSTYGKTPPQLVPITSTAYGKKYNTVAWDRPEYFGPVPNNMRAHANKVCQAASKKHAGISGKKGVMAIGYHPRAQDIRGNTLAGGGYYCNIITRVSSKNK